MYVTARHPVVELVAPVAVPLALYPDGVGAVQAQVVALFPLDVVEFAPHAVHEGLAVLPLVKLKYPALHVAEYEH